MMDALATAARYRAKLWTDMLKEVEPQVRQQLLMVQLFEPHPVDPSLATEVLCAAPHQLNLSQAGNVHARFTVQGWITYMYFWTCQILENYDIASLSTMNEVSVFIFQPSKNHLSRKYLSFFNLL